MKEPGDFGYGFGMGILLHVLLVPITFVVATAIDGWGGMAAMFGIPMYIGFSQLVYIVPTIIHMYLRRQYLTVNGLAAAAIVTVAANVVFWYTITPILPEH